MHGIECRIETSFEELAQMRDEWDRFVIDVGGDIYLSYDWCRVWWEYYGSGRVLQVFIFRVEKELVGIIPMFTERVWLGPVWLHLAKVVGSDFAMTICNPPVREIWAGPVFETVLDRLVSDNGCDALWFGPLSGLYESVTALREVCRKRSGMRIIRDAVYAPHTMFFLPDTFEAYLKSLSKSQRAYYQRKINSLKKTFNISMDVVRDPEAGEEEFMKFQRMHNHQWQSQGHRGHFGAWPKSEAFNIALVRSQGAAGRFRLIRLIANGAVVSYQYAFAFGDCYYWRLPAREIAAEWDRFSLGHVGLVQIIETAIGEGMRRLEGGLGHYEYKMHLGAREYTAVSVLVASNRVAVRFRSRLFLLVASTLNIIYNKIWVRRLSLRLPLRRHPLWETWIRSQL